MTDIAELTFSVNTNPLKKGKDDLKNLADQAGKTEAKAKKTSDGISASFVALAGPIGAAASAIVAAGTAMAFAGIKAAQYEDNFTEISNIAGMAAAEFKGLAYAFDASGVSMEQLAEHSRKTLKELGQFQLTGKGGINDALTSLAGKSTLTAESLRGLSGPDVLQKLKNEFDAANIPISQQQQLFDGVSRGAGRLIPLLKNGGEEISRLTDRYNHFNQSLMISGQASNELGDIADDFDLLKTTMQNATVFLTSEFQPEFKAAMDWVLKAVPNATNTVTTFFDSWRNPENMRNLDAISIKAKEQFDRITDINSGIAQYQKEMTQFKEGTFGRGEYLQLIANLRGELLILESDYAATIRRKEELAALLEQGGKTKEEMALEAEAEALAAKEEAAKKAADAAAALKIEIDAQVSALERAHKTWGMTSSQVAMYDLRMKGADATTLKHAQSLANEIDRLDAQKVAADAAADAQKRLDDAKEKAGQGFVGMMNAMGGETGNAELDALHKEHIERQAIIDEARTTEFLSQQVHDAAMLAEAESYATKRAAIIEKQKREEQQATLNTMDNIVSITSTQINQMRGLFEEGSGIGKAFFVASQTLAAANAIIYGLEASMALEAAYDKLGAGVGNPMLALAGKAHIASAAIMGYTTAGMIMGQTLASFDGGGFTGYGTRTGGMDGKGGKLAVVHPNETILDHTKGQGMAVAPVVNIYEDASKAGRTQSRNIDGKMVVDVFVANILKDGDASKAMQSAFGLRRAAR